MIRDVDVRLDRVGERGLRAQVTPSGVTGELEWSGRRVPLREGAQTVTF